MSQKDMDFFIPNSKRKLKTLFSFIILKTNNQNVKNIFIKNNQS